MVRERLQDIKRRIAEAEQRYARAPGSVQLLAVSKGQPLERMIEAAEAGQRLFAENYLQEALEKQAALTKYPIEWHFIGKIQSNKTHGIAEHFSWVHSISDKKIAQRLNDQRPQALPSLNICIEINISGEASKSGVKANEALALAQFCLTLPRLKLRGLMTIPAPEPDPVKQHQIFHQMATIAESLRSQGIPLDTLSMGMTADFEAAIAEGATIIRLGTGVFGERVDS